MSRYVPNLETVYCRNHVKAKLGKILSVKGRKSKIVYIQRKDPWVLLSQDSTHINQSQPEETKLEGITQISKQICLWMKVQHNLESYESQVIHWTTCAYQNKVDESWLSPGMASARHDDL